MRWRKLGLALAGIAAIFALAVIFTAKPGDPALYPATGRNTVEISLVSNGWHSGLVLPREALTGEGTGAALRSVAIRFRDYPRIEFGWGEARFYRSTPSIRDVDWGLAVEALFASGGNEAVIQVFGLPEDLRVAMPTATIVPIRLSGLGFERLVARLDAAFRIENHQPVEAGPGLYGPSLFYGANGRFSWRNLCNHWAADLLNTAGVPVAPILATHPLGLIGDLEWRSGLVPLPRR